MMTNESTRKAPVSLCDSSLIRRLQALDSCAVSDAADALDSTRAAGHNSSSYLADSVYSRSTARVAMGLQPLIPGTRIAGTVTPVVLRLVRGRLARALGDELWGRIDRSNRTEVDEYSHLGTSTIAAALPGQVVVMANGGRLEMGAWGGLLSLAAQVQGLAGAVVDGACRDIDEIRQLGFPVFACSATPTTARDRVEVASTLAPVFIRGVRVRPLDFVIADDSGVVFIPREVATEVIQRAEAIVARESELAAALRDGRSATEALGRQYEEMLHA